MKKVTNDELFNYVMNCDNDKIYVKDLKQKLNLTNRKFMQLKTHIIKTKGIDEFNKFISKLIGTELELAAQPMHIYT